MTYDAIRDCLTLDRTWQEIRNAAAAGGLICVELNNESTGSEDIYVISHILQASADNQYVVDLFGDISLATSSPSGYPTTCEGGEPK